MMPDSVSIPTPSSPASLAVGMVLSVMLHLALAWVLVAQWSALTTLQPDPRSFAELPRTKPVHAGIEQSRAVSINWLGFASPTRHEATQATTDQAALSPTPSPLTPDHHASTQLPSRPAQMPVASTQNSQKHDQRQAVAAPTPTTPDLASASPRKVSTQQTVIALNERLAKLFKDATSAAQRLKTSLPTPPTPTTGQQTSSPAPGPSSSTSTPAPTQHMPSDMAERSAKESTPTAVATPIDWHPGHPAAAQGLDITTVSPRWSETTRLSALPRNPVVRIDFARDGHVAKAVFLPNLNSGYASVDGPLLDAIYRWRARGQALNDLPDGPDAVVSIIFRIMLNPSRGKILKPKSDATHK